MISVIIPSHNRYDNLVNAISSVKAQTYKDIEIIVVDDGSSDERYKHEISGVKIINLPISSRKKLGYPCGAVARNEGMKKSKGEYISFLDDDDIWMPEKLAIQISEMEKNNIKISSTDGYIGHGYYDKHKHYQLYNKEYYWEALKGIYDLDKDLPDRFTLNIIKKHNSIITSSICFKRELIDKVGYMKLIKNGGQIINGKREWQDWEYWKRLLKYDDCLYIKQPMFYYDLKKY